jgi:thiamine biosynthesis protein ThiI
LTQARVEDAESFAVRVTRADKSFPLTSSQLEHIVGGDIDAMLDIPVDLDAPDFRLAIEIAEGRVFMYTNRREGPRGLPAGISGKLMGLYSAGIDSAVAAYLMGKRGANVQMFHSNVLPDAG